MTTQTLTDIYFAIGFLMGLAIPWLVGRHSSKSEPPSRRPRVIVTLSRTMIPKEIRDSVRNELLGDTERDYVIVEAMSDTAVTALEIR